MTESIRIMASTGHITVQSLLERDARHLKLRLASGGEGLQRKVIEQDLHRPGLALTGFTDLFPEHRIQLLGNTESLYLNRQALSDRRRALETLFKFDLPCVILTNGNRPGKLIRELSEQRGIPVLATPIPTTEFFNLLSLHLQTLFAPREDIHGTLVDVYGSGLLFIGRAGIGKSEIAMDLVERGHRLVADDVVSLTYRQKGILLGYGPEMLRHLLEIRGVGIINIRDMFGVRAVRMQKRVEVVVQLEDWDDKEDYERLGMEDQTTHYLGVELPKVKLPIFPGKNITVICEAIALNLHLKVYGLNAARDLSRRLLKRMNAKRKLDDYLKWDDE